MADAKGPTPHFPKVTVESRNEDYDAMYAAEDDSLQQLDPETIDPEMKYRFVYNQDMRLARMKAKGYDFVVPEDGVRLKEALVGNIDGLGHILVGDSVLMRCPKRRYDRRRRGIRELTEARMGTEAEGGVARQAINDIKQVAENTGLASKIITSIGGRAV